MQDYFERELLNIKREMTYLKTAMQKSAGIVETTSHSVSLNLPLSLDEYQINASGHARFGVNSSDNILMMTTLNWYYDDITKASDLPRTTRHADVITFYDGRPIIRVIVRGTQSDVNTLKNGGSVSIDVILTVRATDEFTLEVL